MKERVCQFGPRCNLTGILTEPAEKDARPGSPVAVMLNAGLLHRVGPHRMSVDLARRLAARGVCSLRFDLGGLGESESSSHVPPDEDHALPDIKDALDFLATKHRKNRFVLFGLCSGADNSYAVAIRDPRVVGAILLDGHGFWTPRSYITHYLPRTLRLRVWLNYVHRIFSPSKDAPEKGALLRQKQLRRPFGSKLQVEREIQSLVDRGTQLLYFYTGGVEEYYNYAGQFFDQFKGLDPRGKIEVEYYPDANHTYTLVEDRERMFARVVEWYCARIWDAH